MSKAIKFKNNMYLDTRGAVHNGTILKTYLDDEKTRVDGKQDIISNLANKIIDSIGSNSNGYWIKYTNGEMICYGSKTFSNLVSTYDYWSFMNRTPENLKIDFAQTFKSAPYYTLKIRCGTSGCVALVENGNPSTTQTGTFGILICKNSTSNRTITVDYVAHGKWK